MSLEKAKTTPPDIIQAQVEAEKIMAEFYRQQVPPYPEHRNPEAGFRRHFGKVENPENEHFLNIFQKKQADTV